MLVKPKLKYIQSLGQKKFRRQEGLFIAEGPKVVKELLEAANENVKEIYALKDWIIENKESLGKTETVEITEMELEKISQLITPNKVVALVRQFDPVVPVKTKGKISLVLDDIQDPGNLGTIIRIADWFGIDQIVCSHETADVYNPKVVQSTMGSIARVRMLYVDLPTWLTEQKDVSIYAATLNGKDVTSMEKIKEAIIIFGNESKGISPELLHLAKSTITIPQKARLNDSVGQGKAESLNAAVAAGIILSHIT